MRHRIVFRSVFALTLAAYAWVGARTALAQNHPAGAPALKTGGSSASGPLGLRMKLGDERVFRIQYRGKAQVDYGLLASSMTADGKHPVTAGSASHLQPFEYDIQASLHWRVVGSDAQGWLVSARLNDVNYTVDGVADSRRDVLQMPFVFHVDRSGALGSFAFPRRYPDALAASIRSIVEPLQIVFVENAVESWTTNETGADSGYKAQYQVTGIDALSGVAHVSKTKTEIYRNALMSGDFKLNGQPEARIGESQTQLDLKLDGSGVERVSAKESVSIHVGSRLFSSTDGSFSAEHVQATLAPLAHSAAEAQAGLNDPSLARARLYEVDPQMVAKVDGLSVTDAMASYVEAVRKNSGAGSRFLRNYVRKYPSRSAEIARVLGGLDEKADDKAISFGFAALSSAGHKEAQQALIDVVTGAGWSEFSREKALIAMMDLDMPEMFAVRGVWDYRNSLRATDAGIVVRLSITTNVYGALGDVQKGNPAVTYEVLQNLSTLLRSSQELDQQQALDALSNVGDAQRIVPLTAPFLTSKSEWIRQSAFKIFRRLDGDTAFQQFATAFAREQSASVRQAASRIAAAMPDTDARAAWAQAQVVRESDPQVAAQCVQILGRGQKTHPSNEAALRALLNTSNDRSLRREIYAFVSPNPAGSAR